MARRTRQRAAIRHTLESADRPLAPFEVLELAQKEVPELGIATVYRNLKELTNQGWIVQLDLPGEPSRYERADLPHHHHFQCIACKRVFEIPACPGGLIQPLPQGYSELSHVVLIYGRCQQCNREKRPRALVFDDTNEFPFR